MGRKEMEGDRPIGVYTPKCQLLSLNAVTLVSEKVCFVLASLTAVLMVCSLGTGTYGSMRSHLRLIIATTISLIVVGNK